MNFKEMALEAYQKQKLKDELQEQKDADTFCDKAVKALKDQFDIEEDIVSRIKVIEKKAGSLKINLDDVITSIIFRKGNYEFEVIKKCPKCGEEYSVNVKSLENIGKFLVTEHNKFDCDQKVKKIETTKDRFMNALRDLIYDLENDL